MKVLCFAELREKYGISKEYLTKLLNTKGCPVLPRQKYQPYRVIEEEFDAWLRTRKN